VTRGTGTQALAIQLQKRRDGTVVLRCDRPDGTSTWRKYEGAKAQYLALHDLSHYAVESTLGLRRGFFGLVADGWNIGDFGTPWPRGPLPADAEPVEQIVAFFAIEATSGTPGTAEELRAELRGKCAAPVPAFDEETLARVRAAAGDLRRRWLALPPDGALALSF
jgi:hypothetical protein